MQLWLRAHGRESFVLAVLYFLFGHASFLVQVDDVLVTPVLFAPEGIALAMALRFGAGVWPGVFAGQLALALSRGLATAPAVSISAINSLEAVLAVLVFRALKLDATLPRARDLAGLLLLIFFLLQPFSATLGNATLWAGGIVDRATWLSSWVNWWIGNSFGQMLVAPLLLALFAGARTKLQTAGDFVVPLLVILPALWAAEYILRWTGMSSLVVVFAPILVLLAIYRGLAAVCVGGLLVAVGALYATSHAFGPFVSDGQADIPSLNLFIIGLTLSGQFLAIFLKQLRDQQKLAGQLRDAREQLQRTAYELTANIPVGTYVIEFDNAGQPRFTFVSERWLKMLDLRREDVLADPTLAMNAVHPDEREAFRRLNAEVHAENKRFFWEGRIVVRGETRWVTIESIPRTRPGGGTVWEGVMIDITDRKLAEAQLSDANRNMQLAASAARLGFWELEVETGRDRWDEEMARIHDIAPADFDGCWEKFVHPDDYEEVMRETRRMLESDKIFAMDYRIVRPSGEVRHVREHGLVTRNAAGHPIRARGVLQDVTAEKEAAHREKHLAEEHRRDLENKLKTSLTASAVAHEINQPLSSILLRSKMTLEQPGDESQALRVIAEEAHRVVVTIEKMKTLLRSVQTEHHAIDLAAVGKSTLLYNRPHLQRHRIHLRTTGLEHCCPLDGDDVQLQLALTNLLRNAVEAIDGASPARREILVELINHPDGPELVIGDSGPGWPPRGPAEIPLNTTKKSGTGIGLYVVRTTVQNHRGEIVFGRSPLGGAEVRLRFPR